MCNYYKNLIEELKELDENSKIMSEHLYELEFEMKDLLSVLDKEIMEWIKKKNDKKFAHSIIMSCSRVLLKNSIANTCLHINKKDLRKVFIKFAIKNLEEEIIDMLEDHESINSYV